MKTSTTIRPIERLLEENELLREEVRVARRASEIAAGLVVQQFARLEDVLRRLEDSHQSQRVLNSLLRTPLDKGFEEVLEGALEGLAEMMGGGVWVESEVGKGSAFHFTIHAQASEIAQLSYMTGEQPELRGKWILVVDDNATNRQILAVQAQSWGMIPVVASSGPEALDIIRRGERLDLAVLDYQMPEMDGMTLAEEIRLMRDERSLPLVMLTSVGSSRSDPRVRLFAAYLTKPIKASALYNTLVDVLARVPGQTHRRPKQAEGAWSFDAHMGERLPMRILLAEDNVVNQKVALRTLEKMAYQADVAGNGVQALEALARQPYDVVLMDMQMPEMDGLEASRRIRAGWSEARRPAIIAMTANAMQGDREICLEAGMDDYVTKPIQPKELQTALERWGQWVHERRRSLEAKEAAGNGAAVAAAAESEAVEVPIPAAHLETAGLSIAATEESESDLPPALDRSVLGQLRDLDPESGNEMVRELVELFMADAPGQRDAVRAAVAAGDARQLREAAHALKGASSNLGAKTLAAVCFELEKLGRSGTVEGSAELLAQLEREFRRACRALESLAQESA